MKRNYIPVLIGCAVVMCLILTALYVSSPLIKDLYRGGFDRSFVPETGLTREAVAKLENKAYYIAGSANGRVYLGNYIRPLSLLSYNRSLTESTPVKIKITGLDSIQDPQNFRIAIDSPNFFITHGTMPLILRGKLGQWEAKPVMQDSNYFFSRAVPIGSNSLALRSYSAKDQSDELARKSIDTPYFELKTMLLEKQKDGIFCVDGAFSYSRDVNRLVYSYYYRNEFIVCDSNLNLVYRGNTIDTFSRAKIQISDVTGGVSVLQAQPRRVNGKSIVSGNYLFVNSNVLAKNQNAKQFLNGLTIDVYDVTTGNYAYSFQIPNYNKLDNSDFQVRNNELLAIHGRYLVRYELNPQAISNFVLTRKK